MGVITETERQKYLAYLDGVADGLNESRNDVNEVLDKISAEIDELPSYVARFNGGDFAIHIDKEKVLEIINKYRGEAE